MYFDLRLFGFTAGVRCRLALAVALGLLAAAAGVGRLALSGYAIALVLRGAMNEEVTLALAGVASCIVGRSVFQYLREVAGYRAGARVQIKLRRVLYEKALALGPAVLDQERTGDLLISLVDGVDQLESFFSEYLPQMVVAVLTVVGIFVFMALLDLPIAFVYLTFALFTLGAPAMLTKATSSKSVQRRKAYGDLSAEVLDSIQGLATLKAFGQSGARGSALAAKARRVFRSTMNILVLNATTTGVTWLGITAGAAVALGWGAFRVSNGSLELAPLLIVVMLGVEVFRPLRELTTVYHRGMLGVASAAAIADLLDARPFVDDVEPRFRQTRLVPSLEFDNVSFVYPTRKEPALKGISFRISAGQSLGIVGPSGAGKSTLVWLAMRFFDPAEGRVLLGGRDLRELPLATIRQHIAIVSQDTYLFHGTVSENLRLAKPDATQAELEEAAKNANAHGFITDFPDGYATVVGERGARLSGGQRQRIAIARALLKDAPILIMDEALSSVDAENESLIQEALNRLMRRRTTLVIAHRLSSVIATERILVLKNGRAVEEGPHDHLIHAGGVYGNLMAGQLEPGPAQLTHNASRHVSGADTTALGSGDVVEVASNRHSRNNGASAYGPLALAIRLLDLVKPWRGRLIATFFSGVLRVLAVIGLGVTSALVVRRVAEGASFGDLLVVLGIVSVLVPMLHWAESWLPHDMAFRLLAEMRIGLYRKLDPLAPAYLLRRRTGDIVSVVTSDVDTIEYFFAHTIAPAFVAVIVPLSILAVLAAVQWPLALALAPFLLFVAYTPFLSSRHVERLAQLARQRLGEVNAHMVDSIQGMREIVAFGREVGRTQEVVENQHRYAASRLHFWHHLSLQRALIEGAIGLGGLSVMATGTYFVTSGALSGTMLPLLSLMALAAFIPISELAHVAKQLADTFASANRVFAIHDEPIPVRDGKGHPLPKDGARGLAVRFQGVTFAYEAQLPSVLKEVTFSIEPGQTVALVGRSGAGKTTAVHLLMRFWDPTEGTITVDGLDLREFHLDDLRHAIALVAQETYLFNATLRDNLKLAKPEATEEEIVAASQQANAHEFISALPYGYDTMVGERGIQLSGGQRQRIAIARAVLKDAPILVLDEATSHLDAENERLVRSALARLMRGRTTLVIGHRLSTVRDADKIVVLDKGRLIETGTHHELLARGGLYAYLVSSQVLGGKLAPKQISVR